MVILFLSVLFLSFGIIVYMDANRFKKHIKVAETLMDNGLTEDRAMELSGCTHWDAPWYKRIFEKYPDVPLL